jgi:hypothetical protein
MGVAYSTLWSEDFTDEDFLSGIRLEAADVRLPMEDLPIQVC